MTWSNHRQSDRFWLSNHQPHLSRFTMLLHSSRFRDILLCSFILDNHLDE